jgi:hypothetical protein
MGFQGKRRDRQTKSEGFKEKYWAIVDRAIL